MNSSRVHLEAFVTQAAKATPPGAVVLDAGAGHGPYRHLWSHVDYRASDIAKLEKDYVQLDYVCDLVDVPVDDATFDVVLITQVLEHVPDPAGVLKEMHRILKPGGTIYASTPLYYEEHEQPWDFYRYTQFAWRHLFGEAGFKDLRIEWLEGYLGTVSYQLDFAARSFAGRRFAPLRAILRPLSRAAARSDVKRKRTHLGHPKNYTVVATR